MSKPIGPRPQLPRRKIVRKRRNYQTVFPKPPPQEEQEEEEEEDEPSEMGDDEENDSEAEESKDEDESDEDVDDEEEDDSDDSLWDDDIFLNFAPVSSSNSCKKESNFSNPADFLSINLTEGAKKNEAEFSSEDDEDELQEFLSRRERIRKAISGIESRGTGTLKDGSSNLSNPPLEHQEHQEPMNTTVENNMENNMQNNMENNLESIDNIQPQQQEHKDLHQGLETAEQERLYPEPPEPSIYHQEHVQHNPLTPQSPYSSTVDFIRGHGLPNLQDLRSPEPSSVYNLQHKDSHQ